MLRRDSFTYEIQYTNAAEKFFRKHEDVREEYRRMVLTAAETTKM